MVFDPQISLKRSDADLQKLTSHFAMGGIEAEYEHSAIYDYTVL